MLSGEACQYITGENTFSVASLVISGGNYPFIFCRETHTMLVTIILYLIVAIYVGILARQRGRGFGAWFFVSLAITPLIAAVVLLKKPDLAEKDFVESVSQDLDLTHVKCPHCAEYVLPEATQCKYCHNKLTPAPDVVQKRVQDRLEAGLEDLHSSQSNTIILGGAAVGAALLTWFVWAMF